MANVELREDKKEESTVERTNEGQPKEGLNLPLLFRTLNTNF